MKPFAKLYLIGDDKPYELNEATYKAVIRSLDKKFILLPNGSVVMTASIRNIDTEDRVADSANRYDRRGLPPISECDSLPVFDERPSDPEQRRRDIENARRIFEEGRKKQK